MPQNERNFASVAQASGPARSVCTFLYETLEAVADRGYFNGEEIKTCVDAGITVTLPKSMTSSAKAEGRLAWRISCLSLPGRRETYIPF